MSHGLEGKTALVLGGGRGIGRAVALELGIAGAGVGVLARSPSEVDATVAAIKALGARSVALLADITDAAATAAALTRLEAELGPPSVVVFSTAAYFEHKKLHNIGDAEMQSFIASDLLAPLAVCRALLPGMLRGKFGRLVFIGSLASRVGLEGAPLYCAVKAGLEGLVRGLAIDYARYGITANVVAPGMVETERFKKRMAGDPDKHERRRKSTAARRLLSPKQVADAVLFLCGSEAWGISGSVLDVNNGQDLAIGRL